MFVTFIYEIARPREKKISSIRSFLNYNELQDGHKKVNVFICVIILTLPLIFVIN